MSAAASINSIYYDTGAATGFATPRWYAVHTRVNQEKRLAEQLAQRSIEHFLPLYESVRRWKDRNVTLHMPLFPGYLLIHIEIRDKLRVLQIPGAARLVSFNGNPEPLEDAEIDALRQTLGGQVRVEPHPYSQIGQRVRVKAGTLAGLEGILVKKKNEYRIVLSIDLIMRSIAAEVDIADVETVLHSQ
jgi:transcription antitermination factor NusG